MTVALILFQGSNRGEKEKFEGMASRLRAPRLLRGQYRMSCCGEDERDRGR